MPLQQSIDNARPNNFADVLARTGEALDFLRARHADGKLPLLHLPEKRDDIAAILSYAAVLRDAMSTCSDMFSEVAATQPSSAWKSCSK